MENPTARSSTDGAREDPDTKSRPSSSSNIDSWDVEDAINQSDNQHVENVITTNCEETASSKRGGNVGVKYDMEEMRGLTLVEAKGVLINRALDRGGMGRFQWAIFALCGFGYCLDLLWAQALGLIAPRMQIELQVPDSAYGNIFTAFSVGMTVGAAFWGVMVDIVGRRWAFNLCLLVTSVFGLIIGAPSDWKGLCIIASFMGFGVGGQIPTDATILLEFLPNDKRWLLTLLSIFQPLGSIFASLISWGLVPRYACSCSLEENISSNGTCCTRSNNQGWRYTAFCLGALSIFLFFVRFFLFSFRESPKFLLAQGRDSDAVRVIQSIAKFNRSNEKMVQGDEGECWLTEKDLVDLEKKWLEERSINGDGKDPLVKLAVLPAGMAEDDIRVAEGGVSGGSERKWKEIVKAKAQKYRLYHLKGLFVPKRMACLTVITWLIYACDYWGFVIAGSFLPQILARKNAAAKLSVNETYRNYVIISGSGIPGVVLGAILVDFRYLGRKYSMTISSAMMGVSLFLFTAIDGPAANVGFNAMEYFFQSTFNAILYAWAPEAFPAAFRGSAVGIASMWGRLTSILAPIIATHLLSNNGGNGAIYLAGGGVFVASLLTFGLPETRVLKSY